MKKGLSLCCSSHTSGVLISEAHVAEVSDPAGGSYAVEKLTDDMTHAAWDLFGEIDAADSLDAALAVVRTAVEATVSERALAIAQRTRPITGVSEFPNLHETLPQRRPYAEELDVHRYAGEFEAMRDDRAAAPVFLATMGTVAAHTSRASFATNLFAAGGVDTVAAGPTENVEEVVAAYQDAGKVAVVCLIGNAAAYDGWGADLITALRAAGAKHVVIAGTLPDGGPDLDVDATAAVGDDALAFLRTIRQELQA